MSRRPTPDNGTVNTLADGDDVQEEVSEAGRHPLGWPRIKVAIHYTSVEFIKDTKSRGLSPNIWRGGGEGQQVTSTSIFCSFNLLETFLATL